MGSKQKKLRLAVASWEIGRASSGLGVKEGGLGGVMEELPSELIQAAAALDIELAIEILCPCFGHFDRSRMTRLPIRPKAVIAGASFPFEVYEHRFEDGQRVIYFWDDWQLGWTRAQAIYPEDPQVALKMYAAVSQAMAGYIQKGRFDTIHLHDYHVGLIPFYLDEGLLGKTPVHFTIHNASYQGITPPLGSGTSALDRIGLPGEKLFPRYFDFFGNLNLLKASMLRVHELGGKITTVSGDLRATWGYARELKESHETIYAKALGQKGVPPAEVFVPSLGLDLFEKLPVAGITNGMKDDNRADRLPWLRAGFLSKLQKKNPAAPLFSHPETQREMLSEDHRFDRKHLAVKAELKRLLQLEAFGCPPEDSAILCVAVGRMVEQKNFEQIGDIVERTLDLDGGTRFLVLVSDNQSEYGRGVEARFHDLVRHFPERVFFRSRFNIALSKLMLAGGDFCLIPSRFEPCGLVDYEASLLGTLVVGRQTGGLAKVRACSYLYDWLDTSDTRGEADAFFEQLRRAIRCLRNEPERHRALVETALSLDASWRTSAKLYLQMYQYGVWMRKWHTRRQKLIQDFVGQLGEDRDAFSAFFQLASGELADRMDGDLRTRLDGRP